MDLIIERSSSALTEFECKWKERPVVSDRPPHPHVGRGSRVKERIIVCRAKAAYRLADGTWVLKLADKLKRLTCDQR